MDNQRLAGASNFTHVQRLKSLVADDKRHVKYIHRHYHVITSNSLTVVTHNRWMFVYTLYARTAILVLKLQYYITKSFTKYKKLIG